METERTVTIRDECGGQMDVTLLFDGERLGTCLRINGIPHHFEMMPVREIVQNYILDTDPDYRPHADDNGFCYVMVPFSR